MVVEAGVQEVVVAQHWQVTETAVGSTLCVLVRDINVTIEAHLSAMVWAKYLVCDDTPFTLFALRAVIWRVLLPNYSSCGSNVAVCSITSSKKAICRNCFSKRNIFHIS